MRFLKQFEDLATVLALATLFIVVGLQFFTRYVLNDSLGWTEEVARMILIVLTYVGSIVCARKSSHIQVNLLFAGQPAKIGILLLRVFDFVSALVLCFLTWTAVQFASQTRLMMSSIEFPKSIIYWICAVSLLLMALHFFSYSFGWSKRFKKE